MFKKTVKFQNGFDLFISYCVGVFIPVKSNQLKPNRNTKSGFNLKPNLLCVMFYFLRNPTFKFAI